MAAKGKEREMADTTRAAPDLPPVLHVDATNLRIFQRLSLTDLSWCNIIMGANGSGKTTLLWVILIALRAYNLHWEQSKHRERFPKINIEKWDMAELLNARHLGKASWVDIAHKASQPQRATVTARVVNSEIKWNISGNGTITFELVDPSSNFTITPKVRYAFMSYDSWARNGKKENMLVDDLLTSESKNQRARYIGLDKEYKASFCAILRDLFDVLIEVDAENNVYLRDASLTAGEFVEILYQGEALRKVFTALVLFFGLVSAQPSCGRIYLIEEPEANLYPSLQVRFVDHLRRLCSEHTVQLFMTTNSTEIYQTCVKEEVIILQKDVTGPVAVRVISPDDLILNTAIHLPILAIRNNDPLILLEGKQDDRFLRVVAEQFNVKLEGFQMLAGAKFKGASHFAPLIAAIRSLHPGIQVTLVRDSDFFMGDAKILAQKEADELKVRVVYWDLPCIESYLFVDWCSRTKDPFAVLRNYGRGLLLAKFLRCWKDKNEGVPKPLKGSEADACEQFLVATPLLDKLDPSSDDILAVAKILHGHSWEGMPGVANRPTLIADMIRSRTITTTCPSLGPLVKTIFS